MYYHGYGRAQDFHKAMEYFLEAANKGNLNAQYYIGNH